MTVEIGSLGPGDEHLFERIAPDVFDHAVERATLAHYLGTPGHHQIVALAKGEIVGQLAATTCQPRRSTSGAAARSSLS
jgi:hypothetical protein